MSLPFESGALRRSSSGGGVGGGSTTAVVVVVVVVVEVVVVVADSGAYSFTARRLTDRPSVGECIAAERPPVGTAWSKRTGLAFFV